MSAIATDRRVGVIGMGHMAEALVSGAISAGVIKPDSVICSRRGRDALTRIADEMGVGVTRDNAEVVVSSDLVLLSVKPQQLQDVMPRLSAHWRPGQVLVSVMAGVTLARLEAQIHTPDVAVVRVMPNSPCIIGKGVSAFCLGHHAGPDEARLVTRLFGAVGDVVQVEESQMDAVTALSGSGPAYVYLFLEALAAAGEKVGLEADVASALALATFRGAAQLAMESDASPGALRGAVTSPGGTTEAALEVLETSGFLDIVADAVVAARDRGRELGRG